MVYVHGAYKFAASNEEIATILYSKWQQKRHSGKRENIRIIIYNFSFFSGARKAEN